MSLAGTGLLAYLASIFWGIEVLEFPNFVVESTIYATHIAVLWLIQFPNSLLPLLLYPITLILAWALHYTCSLILANNRTGISSPDRNQQSNRNTSNATEGLLKKTQEKISTFVNYFCLLYVVIYVLLMSGLWVYHQGVSLHKNIFIFRVRTHSQNMTTAARAQADRKTFGHLS